MRTEASENLRTSQNLRENNKENKDRANTFAKSLSQGKKKEKIEKKPAQNKETQAKTTIGFKERIKSPKAVKKPAEENAQTKKKAPRPISSKKETGEVEGQRISTKQRILQKITRPSSSKKDLNKPGKNERSSNIICNE